MEELLKLTPDDAWVAYSLPGATDHVLVQGSCVTSPSSEAVFILQGWDPTVSPRLFLIPDHIHPNGQWHADVIDKCALKETARPTYEGIVGRTLEKIKAADFEKAVISRVKLVPRGEEGLYELFMKLKGLHRKAFTFMYHMPGQGTWCGATPEILLHADEGQMRTDALAGTLPCPAGSLADTPWSDKEKHEQHLIELYVEQMLNREQISYAKVGPVTVKAGAMVHLKTTYSIPDTADHLRLINMLHPGPAICGQPKKASRLWIDQEEEHDREHYCGYLGPWGISGQKSIFIHLRSMRIYKDQYALYLGGGITADSDISKEWDETELKANTLMSAIKSDVHV